MCNLRIVWHNNYVIFFFSFYNFLSVFLSINLKNLILLFGEKLPSTFVDMHFADIHGYSFIRAENINYNYFIL